MSAKLKELLDSMPSLHDSALRSYEVDYIDRTATLRYDVWCPEEDDKEKMRPGRLLVRNLLFMFFEGPILRSDERHINTVGGGLNTSELMTSDELRERGMKSLQAIAPEGYHVVSQYVDDTNSMIHIVAKDFSFKWDD